MQRSHVDITQITDECLAIQCWGLEECTECQYHDTDQCNGKEIIKTHKNKKGHTIPLDMRKQK